ncbi:MAG: 1,4-alpha-glucan branching protein GlgB [Actinomycetota bacterium]
MSRSSSRSAAAGSATKLITAEDLHWFNEGTHARLFERLGAHPTDAGTHFAVWAPNAEGVSVIGDFNGWDRQAHEMAPEGTSGIWTAVVDGAPPGSIYKFHVLSRHEGYAVDKADPLAFHTEVPPKTGSVVWDLSYRWDDDEWMTGRPARQSLDQPISIYEMHIGSWVRDEAGSWLGYRELAPRLREYLDETGFTHVEFLPVMEHPFYGSWGYQTTGYFAPSSRYGTPQDFMFLIDHLHQAGFGVILDWVPSHFPTDEHGVGFFDGTHLYEHADPRLGFHPDWNSYIFNYGRNEVRSFLVSSAMHWLSTYHADGLRVDAVASMLYLDYSRKPGEWIPNPHGGRENLDAIEFLRTLNTEAYRQHPGIQIMAEESTAWPMVSRPTYLGGLGFGLKWDMGWMHDTLKYLSREPVHRKFHHGDLTFRQVYAESENFVLPLSHDEVVHGKGSLIGKMPGDDWQRFANLRLLFGYMYAQTGKKLLFMGAELGQWAEWNHDRGLDWDLLDDESHAALRRWVADLNRAYRSEPALHAGDAGPGGFEWIDANDQDASVLTFLRRDPRGDDVILVACNFTPIPRPNYLTGVPRGGRWDELLNSDAEHYGGSGWGNFGGLSAVPVAAHGRPRAVNLTLPPLGCVFLKSPA